MSFYRALLFSLAVLIAGCSPPAEAPNASAQVAALAEEAWEHLLAESPYHQVRQGRLLRELPDFTPEQAAADAAFARSLLRKIEAVPTSHLAHEDALTLAILRWDAENVVELEPYYDLTFPFTPYQGGLAFGYYHQQLSAYPFTDPEVHTEGYLTFLSEYADTLEQWRAHVDAQVDRGIYLSRHALPGTVATLRSLRDSAARQIPVADERLGALGEEARSTFQASVEEVLASRILPAFDSLLAVLESESYAVKAPDAVGLAQYPDGEAYYRRLVKVHTTTDRTPEELHELGKKRVAEREAEMAAIRAELGFSGTQAEFHQKLRTDPRFFASSPEEVEARFLGYVARIEPLLPKYFRTLPQAPYGVERLYPAGEASMTFGYYDAPTADQPVGRYLYNGSHLDERPQIWSGPLIYHELIPGHHFHLALQSENESLPMIRREYSVTAFTEGWANYAANLAREMGLLDDPYDRYGAALFDLFIAVRLVVDTGMNLMGWSLEEGRAYMAAHTFQSETEIATETLRYSTDLNAQALGYKVGLEKLLELRERAKALRGESFDIRDFHDAVLGSGAMPLQVLEDHVEWVFSQSPQREPEASPPSSSSSS